MDKNDSSDPTESPSVSNLPIEHDVQPEQKVFGDPLLLKQIIGHCLRHHIDTYYHTTETSLCSFSARNLRLVTSSWWVEVEKTFSASHKPLFVFTLVNPPAFHREIHDQRGMKAEEDMVKCLDFMDCLLNGTVENPPPPFSLTFLLDIPFTTAMDIWYMQKLFREIPLISSLVKLTIVTILDRFGGGVLHTVLPEVPASLKFLSLKEFHYKRMSRRATQNEFLALINSILTAAPTLENLSLELTFHNEFTWTLASSLTHLAINYKYLVTRLTALKQAEPSTHISFPKLKVLEIDGYDVTDGVTTFDMPIMADFVAEMDQLQVLKFKEISITDLANIWCHHGLKNWPTVKTLVLEEFHHLQTISPQILASVHQSFPSIVHFTLELRIWSGPQDPNWIDGIRYLFQEMTQLKSLKLTLNYVRVTEEFLLDPLFLGTTSEKAAQLRNDPSLWDNFIQEAGQGDNGGSGIKNLRDLKRLYLSGNVDHGFHYNFDNFTLQIPAIVSPLVFKLGFNQLPQLDHLTLHDVFFIGMKDASKEWLDQSAGRTLVVKNQYGSGD